MQGEKHSCKYYRISFFSTQYSTACIIKDVKIPFWGTDIEKNKQATGSFQLKHIALRFNNYVCIKMHGERKSHEYPPQIITFFLNRFIIVLHIS